MEQQAESSYLGLSWDGEVEVICARLGYINRRKALPLGFLKTQVLGRKKSWNLY